MSSQTIDWKKYVIVLIITTGLFAGAVFFSNYFDQRRFAELKTIQDKISLDLLSSEAEFSILQELSCKDVNQSFLSPGLNELESKIQYSENNIGTNNPEVINLKRYYTILQIKDYLLMKHLSERCKLKSAFILYVYSLNNCPDCAKEILVLNNLREKYPNLRVYSFDYDIDLSAMQALIKTYKIEKVFPALVVNGAVLNGYKSVEDIEKLIPDVVKSAKEAEKAKEDLENSPSNVTSSSKTVK